MPASRTAPSKKRPAPSRKKPVRRRSAAPARSVAQRTARRRHIRDAVGLGMVASALYLAAILYLAGDGGAIGSNVGEIFLLAFGHASFVIPPIALACGVLLVLRSGVVDLTPFRTGIVLAVWTLLLSFGSDRFGLGDGTALHIGFEPSQIVEHGGYVGAVLYYATYQLFGEVGTTILCLFPLALSVLLLTGSTVQAATGWGAGKLKTAAHGASSTGREVAALARAASSIRPVKGASDALASADLLVSERFPDIFGDLPPTFSARIIDERPEPLTLHEPVAESITVEADTGPIEQIEQLELAPDTEPQPKKRRLKAIVTDAGSYRLPDPALLTKSKGVAQSDPGDVERIKRLLVETLGHFGIESRVTGMVPGPRVSRYELSLAPGTRMSKIENLRKDLSYALATTEIRILAPIPGKSAVGIEVENAQPGTVTLGDIYKHRPKGSSPLFVSFGKDISGAIVGADLARMPHLLVAGTTGSGKSGCMNVILSSIILGASPDAVRMLLIDPKKVELSTYEGIPHLLTPVVTNMKKASNALGNVIAQMEDRYASMDVAGARTLPEFNVIRAKRGQEPVPYILIVIDELADLVMTSKHDVEDAVIRIAQKGRAAGFHLVVATQRPSVDVITGMIKSNIPSRIAFAVSSQTDSRVILDHNGAETLLGGGDMLFKPVWARTTQRVQGAWISEPEVRQVCEASRKQRDPEYDEDLLREPEGQPTEDVGAVNEDERLAEAIQLIAEYQTCSASFFQRRMRVGYTRGARLVDMLERRGLVAPGEGPKPRSVLITAEDVPKLLEEYAQVAASVGSD